MQTLNVLFLCTGNSARSVMAEALLSARGGERFRAFSAGSHPTGKVNPFALEKVRALGLTAEGFRSKSWEEFAAPGAPTMDAIITVCDSAAGEVCPIWPGVPATAHWGFPDPAAVEGGADEKRAAFHAVFLAIEQRVGALLALPVSSLDARGLKAALREIGEH